jgi:hypothetical protein
MLSLKEVPWLSDHVVASDVVFPAAGYITMATEAVRQLSSHPASFTIRALSIGSAMPLHNGRTTEIMTRLQPHRLTDNQDSAWFDFSVMSYDGNRWSRHCSGEIRTADALNLSATELNSTAPEGKREVATAKWYQAAKSVGLEYGPLFQGLQDIFYDLSRGCTSATLQSTKQYYGLLHPTTIDQLLQCCILGSVQGHGRLLNRMALPVYIEEMSIRAGDNLDDLQCDAYTLFSGHDTFLGHGQIGARGGALALQAKGSQKCCTTLKAYTTAVDASRSQNGLCFSLFVWPHLLPISPQGHLQFLVSSTQVVAPSGTTIYVTTIPLQSSGDTPLLPTDVFALLAGTKTTSQPPMLSSGVENDGRVVRIWCSPLPHNAYGFRIVRTSRIFSVTMLKTTITILQGVADLYPLIEGLLDLSDSNANVLSVLNTDYLPNIDFNMFAMIVGVDRLFFPLAISGLLRLCAAPWLTEDFYYSPSDKP